MKLKISKEARKKIIKILQECDRYIKNICMRYIVVERNREFKSSRYTYLNDSTYRLEFGLYGNPRPKRIPKLIFKKIGAYKIGFKPKDLNLILRKKIIVKKIFSKSKVSFMNILTLE